MTKIDDLLNDEQKEKVCSPFKERIAQRGGPGQGFKDGFQMRRFLKRVADAVEATDEQREQLDTIGKEFSEAQDKAREARREAMKENRDKIRELHSQLREASKEGDSETVDKIRKEIQELIKADNKNAVAVDETLAKIEKILTDEQKEKVRTSQGTASETD